MKITNVRCCKKMCEKQIKKHTKNTEQPFGPIYLATNITNRKVYVGKVGFPRTIEDRWHDHLVDGRRLRRERASNPDKRVYDTHLNNAIAKYDESVWQVSQIDIAFSLEELNEKERYWIKTYDSMNRKKGYNMTEGGDGGRPRQEVIEILRKKSSERWKDKKFIEKQSNGVKKKWKEQEYIDKQRKAMERKQNSREYKEILRKIQLKLSKIVKNKAEFLNDIKEGMKLQELTIKYSMSHPTILRNIRMILGKYGVKDYRQARRYLNKKEFLIDIKNGMLAKEIMRKHKTNNRGFSRMIREYLGCYGLSNYRDAKEFLEDKNIEEILRKD